MFTPLGTQGSPYSRGAGCDKTLVKCVNIQLILWSAHHLVLRAEAYMDNFFSCFFLYDFTFSFAIHAWLPSMSGRKRCSCLKVLRRRGVEEDGKGILNSFRLAKGCKKQFSETFCFFGFIKESLWTALPLGSCIFPAHLQSSSRISPSISFWNHVLCCFYGVHVRFMLFRRFDQNEPVFL